MVSNLAFFSQVSFGQQPDGASVNAIVSSRLAYASVFDAFAQVAISRKQSIMSLRVLMQVLGFQPESQLAAWPVLQSERT